MLEQLPNKTKACLYAWFVRVRVYVRIRCTGTRTMCGFAAQKHTYYVRIRCTGTRSVARCKQQNARLFFFYSKTVYLVFLSSFFVYVRCLNCSNSTKSEMM
jgi:hypothetical protein